MTDSAFDRGKFKELVLFVSQRSIDAGDEGFGIVKLNKLLFHSDFESFRLLGRAMTGETYLKQEFGPVASDLPIVLDELAAAGRLSWLMLPSGPYTRKVPTLSDDPEAVADMSRFSDAERQIIEDTLAQLAVYGGKSVSEWSHEQSAGWNVVELREEIPYATAFISTEPIPEEDRERARQFVRDEGWVKAS